MVDWYWIPVTAVISGSLGCLIMAIVAGGNQNPVYVCPHSFDDKECKK